MWVPLVTMVVRVAVSALSTWHQVSVRPSRSNAQFNPYSTFSEGVCLFAIAVMSFASYIPARVVRTTAICYGFSLVPVGYHKRELAVAAAVILLTLLVLLVIGLARVGFHLITEKIKDRESSDNSDSARTGICIRYRRKADLNLIYYGLPLVLSYVSP